MDGGLLSFVSDGCMLMDESPRGRRSNGNILMDDSLGRCRCDGCKSIESTHAYVCAQWGSQVLRLPFSTITCACVCA